MTPTTSDSKKFTLTSLPSWCLWPDLRHFARVPSVSHYDGIPIDGRDAPQYWVNFFTGTSDAQLSLNVRDFTISYYYFVRRVADFFLIDLRSLLTSFQNQMDPMVNFFAFVRNIEFKSKNPNLRNAKWTYFAPKNDEALLYEYYVTLLFLGSAFSEENKLPPRFHYDSSYWFSKDFVNKFITSFHTYRKNIEKVESIISSIYGELINNYLPINITPAIVHDFLAKRPPLENELRALLDIDRVQHPMFLEKVLLSLDVLQKTSTGKYPLPSYVLHYIRRPALSLTEG